MINFSANLSMMFNEVNFFERFNLAKEYNFTGVEYLFPYEYQVEEIQSALEKNELKQILFDLPAGDWNSGDRGIAVQPKRVGEFQDSVEVAIEYAKALNCKRITCLAGIPDIDVSAEISRKTLVEVFGDSIMAHQRITQGRNAADLTAREYLEELWKSKDSYDVTNAAGEVVSERGSINSETKAIANHLLSFRKVIKEWFTKGEQQFSRIRDLPFEYPDSV